MRRVSGAISHSGVVALVGAQLGVEVRAAHAGADNEPALDLDQLGFLGSVVSDELHNRDVNLTEAVVNAGVGDGFGALGEVYNAGDVALKGRSLFNMIGSRVKDPFGWLEAVSTTISGTDVHLVLNLNGVSDAIDPIRNIFQPSMGLRYAVTC